MLLSVSLFQKEIQTTTTIRTGLPCETCREYFFILAIRSIPESNILKWYITKSAFNKLGIGALCQDQQQQHQLKQGCQMAFFTVILGQNGRIGPPMTFGLFKWPLTEFNIFWPFDPYFGLLRIFSKKVLCKTVFAALAINLYTFFVKSILVTFEISTKMQ